MSKAAIAFTLEHCPQVLGKRSSLLPLALRLAHEARADGVIMISNAVLAKDLNRSVCTVRAQLRALEGVEWLRCVRRSPGGPPSAYVIAPMERLRREVPAVEESTAEVRAHRG